MQALKWAVLLALAAVPGLARAELTICNETGDRHAVAIAHDTAGTWVSEGWWNLQPGGCATVLQGDLAGRYYYYRAQAAGRRFLDQDYRFCTRRAAFTIRGDADCAARGHDRAGFRRIDTGGSASFTLRFADGVSPRLAERAPDRPGAAAEAAGSWGEPYVSGRALFQGCASGAEPLVCSFHDGGTKFFVRDDGRTPAAIFRVLRTYRPGTPIELRGDLLTVRGRRADIVLRQVLPRRWTGWDSMLERLQGRWQSVDDPQVTIDIAGSELQTIRNGIGVGRDFLSAPGGCAGARAGDEVLRIDAQTGAARCAVIVTLEGSAMTLQDLPGGDLRRYRRRD